MGRTILAGRNTIKTFSEDSIPDYTNKYNTQIPENRKDDFKDWVATINELLGRDFTKDKIAYDIQGAFLAGLKPGADLHWPDTFKKPNHPVFSNESIYNGADGYEGGTWKGNDFIPGKANIEHYGIDALRDFMNRYGNGGKLIEEQ